MMVIDWVRQSEIRVMYEWKNWKCYQMVCTFIYILMCLNEIDDYSSFLEVIYFKKRFNLIYLSSIALS